MNFEAISDWGMKKVNSLLFKKCLRSWIFFPLKTGIIQSCRIYVSTHTKAACGCLPIFSSWKPWSSFSSWKIYFFFKFVAPRYFSWKTLSGILFSYMEVYFLKNASSPSWCSNKKKAVELVGDSFVPSKLLIFVHRRAVGKFFFFYW